MFRSATFRLTFWYLLIIVILSTLFSTVLYQVSTAEFNRELRRSEAMRDAPYFAPRGFIEFNRLRIAQIEESKRHILWNIVYFNLAILLLGGAVSYFLARRNLEPIEEAHEAQNRFTADASHELRTPLTAIKTEVEVALRNKKLTLSEAKDLLRSNLEEVQKLEALSTGLLTLARHENGDTTIDTVKVQHVVTEAVGRIQKLAAVKSITVVQEVGNISFEGNHWGMVELVTILLDNAIKYSYPKQTVTVRAKSDTRYLTISVRDEGVGIAPSDLPHIFDRFYRADISRSKAGTSGYGLGLSIAEKIAHSHGGNITVTSTVSRGTVFRVRLPRKHQMVKGDQSFFSFLSKIHHILDGKKGGENK